MVFCNSEEVYRKLLSLRVHGAGKNKYDNVRVGINGRLDTIQAAILLVKFSIFEEELNLRQKVATRYSDGLSDQVKTPMVKEYNRSSWAQYSICHPKRNQIIEGLKNEGVPTAIYYPIPLHLQTAFSHLEYKKGDFPVSELVADQIFSLPMHPYLSLIEQEKIIEKIIQYSV
jgi:dTDP-4-amino-4,6-dideoxygalactose transaminase